MDPQANDLALIFDQEPILREFLNGHLGNTRAFVKAQDGCDNKCTFCITTAARGQGRSRHLGDVVAEIQALASAGYQEVVLTGVHLGSYGKDLDGRTSLKDLIEAILNHSDISRLRVSSLEPWGIDPDFFTLWQNQRLLPHLHMPLQSGSDSVLRRMARRTTRESYRRLARAARAAIPGLSLSTDIILGFPGESEQDFIQSMDFVREINFSRLHAFTYSARPGTAAARMSDQIAKEEKKNRTRRMIELGKTLSLAFHKHNEGKIRSVLWESTIGSDKNGLRWTGYTDNYIRVLANGPVDLFNKITPARLLEAQADNISGVLTSPYGE
jgi:threonylcarbamoyladenosine tRNA methylthiotransferase MtaB